ncbi:heparinase II/III family protein [Paenirhodobacter enshiensis]|uniref:heparinase II/III family protein n=1 Tax=Paenirhodobacter enshiensis TaxID=1105367 RepID=UPI0035B041EB
MSGKISPLSSSPSRGRLDAWRDRRALRAAAPVPSGFVTEPAPRSIGLFARGRQLMAGRFPYEGCTIEAPDTAPWDLSETDPAFVTAMQSFVWLDDLAAVAERPARARAQDWAFDWIARQGMGEGPGWTPEIAGRRLLRQINHGAFLLAGRTRAEAEAFFTTLGRQVQFLSRRWSSVPAGTGRLGALCGMVCATAMLRGLEGQTDSALAALATECDTLVGADGGIASRNPEELLETLGLLVDTASTLKSVTRTPAEGISNAIARIVPTLRLLRMPDGGLARFHGGGCGAPGRLDAVLTASEVRTPAPDEPAMGFVRLQAAGTALVVDAAAPPAGAASARAHASTLAFEMTSGRRPLVVNCGAGESFGPDWALAGRASACQSTLSLEGYSSSRFGRAHKTGAGPESLLTETPDEVWTRPEDPPRRHALFGHDGYRATHGLTHLRELSLTPDGDGLHGTDTIGAMSPVDTKLTEAVLDRAGIRGIPYQLRFHLHPDVDATLDMGGWAVSMALKSGEIWIFRFDGQVDLTLAPSVWLEKGQPGPRATRQIVLSGRLLEPSQQISWTFEKAQVTPAPIRD